MSSRDELITRLIRRRNRRLAQSCLQYLGLDIPPSVAIGHGLTLPHGGFGVVIHERCTVGNNVKIFQGVTLGRADQRTPTSQLSNEGGIDIEDDVIIGAGAVVLFRDGERTVVGRGALIGANSVVTTNVPPGETWAGIPARRVGP